MAATVREVNNFQPKADADGDALIAAFLEAVEVLERVRAEAEELVAKAGALVTQRRAGQAWEEILREEQAPRFSVALADATEAVARASSRVRRAQVETLYRAGVPMHRIGKLLGVTRQRVAVLLKTRQQ